MKPFFTSRLMTALTVIAFSPLFSFSQQTETISLAEDRIRHLMSDFPGAETVVEVCDLRPGETYRVWAVQTEWCQPMAKVIGETAQAAATFDFVAQDDCAELLYQKGDACEGEMFLSLLCTSVDIQSDFQEKVEKMKQEYSQADGGASGIIVFPNNNVTSLVEDVFIGGGCFDVQGVVGIGPDAGRGQFDDGSSTVGIKGGIILESGNIANALGPNNSGGAGNNIGGGSDPDLAALTTAAVFDAVGFEFDFTPTVDSLIFEFAFASEEYCEYVGSTFNDVFGFFISGPGISGPYSGGAANIAQLPNGTTVAINNVNHNSNSGFFIGNSTTCNSVFNPDDIQFDGWTVPIEAKVYLQACETYHIKLVVGDAGDAIFDSAVFLKAQSFSAGNAISANVLSASTGTNLIYEPCNDGMLTFTRVAGSPLVPLVYDLELLPSSTATPGLDYVPLPTQVVIPPGEYVVQIPITVFDDGIIEGVESIILSMDNSCSCSATEIEILIDDLLPIELDLEPQELCIGEIATLDPAPTGGTGQYTYQWSDGSSDPILIVVPPAPPTYSVTVTDNCGSSSTVTTTVSVNQLPTANISGDPLAFLCADDPSSTVDLEITFTGDAPWTFVYSIDGINQAPITTVQNPYILTVGTPGAYQMVSIASAADCEGTAFGIAVVEEITVTTDLQADPATCIIGGTLFANFNGGVPNVYEWSDPTLPNPNSPVQVDVAPGTYSVTITDINGCTAEDEATVEDIEPLEATTSFTNVDCSSGNSGSINIEASSGSTPINYNWSNGLPNQSSQTGLEAGTYYVTIYDNIGCTIMDTMTIENNSVPPEAVANTPGILNCTNINTLVEGTGSATGNNITYQWSGPGVVSGADEINATVNESGTYTIVVTNNDNGCTSSAETEVDIDTAPPTAAATGNEISCTVSEVNLDGNGSSTGSNITYEWTGPGVIAGGNGLTPTVNAAGTYTLTVTNADNGCTESVTAEVTQDSDLPTAFIEEPITLDCNINALILDGSGSSSSSTITYQWYENGTALPGETSTSLSISTPGSYQIIVSDGSNGCEANYAVEVEEDLAEPAVSAEADGQFTCTIDMVGLTANITGSPTDYTYQWSTTDGTIVGGTTAQTATAGTPGDYMVVITSNLNGCTNSALVNVSQDASIPVVEINPADQLDCDLGELQLDGTGSSQGADLTYTWTTIGGTITAGQNTLTPTVNAGGTYILTISNSANGCESENEIVVEQDTEDPILAIGAPPVLDCMVGSLVFDASVSNFPATDLNLVWTTSAGGTITGPTDILNAETSSPGDYTLTVTNLNNGCTDELTVTVEQDIAPPVPFIFDPDELTCTNNTVTLDASFSSSGPNMTFEWTTTTGSIVNGVNTLTPVVNQDGEYILTITNTENHCTASETVTVEQNANVPEAEAGAPSDFTCDITQLNLTGSGSSGPEYSYEWAGPGILNGGTTLNPLVNQPGVYMLTVTNQTNQCTAEDMVTLGTDYAEPAAEAGPGGELSCAVTTMALDGTGSSTTDVTYLWTTPDGSISGGETTLSPQINAPGTYVIEVTNTLNGCTSTDEVLIEEDDDLPDVDIALSPPITCEVLEIILDGTGTETGPDFTYVWGTSGGGNITAGINTLEPTVNAPGTYSLTVTNTATNCTNIGSVTVGEDTTPPAAEAGVTYELDCVETSTILNGGGSATGTGISYLWTTTNGSIVSDETTLSPTVDDPGTYTILVTDASNGCTNTDQVLITESTDLPTANAGALGQLNCIFTEIIVSGTGSSQGSDITYVWTTTDGNITGGANTLNASVDEPGTYTLLVTDNGNGCTTTDAVIVLQNIIEPTAEAGTSDDLTCTTQSLDLDGTGSSAGSDFGYEWTTTDGQILSGANTLNPTIGAVGTYLLTVTDNLNGCTSTDQVQVGQDQSIPSVDIESPDPLTCEVLTLILSATASQGADIEYIWTTNDGNILSGDQTLNPEVDESGTYSLLVTNNTNGCTSEASIAVSQNIEAPSANAGLDFLLDCLGTLPTLNGLSSSGTGTLSYVWETTTGVIEDGANTAEPTVSLAGTYVLTITDAFNGCTATDEVVVSTNGPSADPETYQPGCYGELGAIVVANVSGGVSPYLYSIDGGNTFSTDAIHTNLPVGNYEVIVQDASGCEDVDFINIVQPGIFEVDIVDYAFIEQGEEYQFQVQVNVPLDEISQVSWNPTYGLSCTNCLDPIASPEQSTVYHVQVVTKEGCEDNATMLLEVEEKADIYVPNVFNPLSGNDDNNLFRIFTAGDKDLTVKSFQIYSRWGEVVHERYLYSIHAPATEWGWNGHYHEQLMNPAGCVWTAEIEFEDGRVEFFKGDVTLTH